MSFSYNYSVPMYDESAAVLIAVYAIVLVIALLFGLAVYVMHALSLYTIAKRRGLKNPWLAWVPVGSEWILGSVSDQYCYLVKGEIRSKRKILLGFSLASMFCGAATVILCVVMFVQLVAAGVNPSDSQLAGIIAGPLLGIMALSLLLVAVSITLLVLRYVCLNDLFRSCDPNTATAFLVLSIVGNLGSAIIPFGVLLEPIFLLIVRKKDGGMPPRKDAFIPRPAAYEPWDNQ